MSNKELKELSTEEFLAQLKADANAELYGNVDETSEDNKEKLMEDFNKFTKLVRKYKKVQTQLRELVTLNKDNAELQSYVKLLDKAEEILLELDEARKGYLYDSVVASAEKELENKDVKLSITLPYDKKEFDTTKFYEDYAPDTDLYKKYVSMKSVKGNIKYKIKE